MALVYAAITEACTFRLDERGVCREISASPDANAAALAIAEKCIGAQYVASLDPSLEGCLAPLPKAGLRLLFARTEEDGRIVLVRSGPLERFDEWSPDDEEITMRPQLNSGYPALPGFGEDMEEIEGPQIPPPTRSFNEEETAPFSRSKQAGYLPLSEMTEGELEAVTRRSPSTVRGFPPPPAALGASPAARVHLRNPDRIS